MRRAFVASMLAVTACGSGDQAAQKQAEAICSKLLACSPSNFERSWPDVATCEAREKLAVEDALSANNTAQTPADVEQCANEIGAESCAQFLSDVMPPPHCMPPSGPGVDGSACGFAAQCKSAFCAIAPRSLCGRCQPQPTAGSSCANAGCGPTMRCVVPRQVCQVPVAVGGACSNNLPCGDGLACVGFTISATGTCEMQVTTLGAQCDRSLQFGPDCNADDGLTCGTGNSCVALPIVPPPQTCGAVSGVETECAAGAACGTFGNCIAPAADGASCGAFGRTCVFPAVCTGTRTCALPGGTC